MFHGFEIAAIVCTRNPRLDYFARTLEGLRSQTLSKNRWELIVVDNGSDPPVASRMAGGDLPLAWNSSSRLVVEDEPGLMNARRRGYTESSAELVVFVDDDNVLMPDYLENALQISREWVKLGTFGGACMAEYETPPAPALLPYVGGLAVRDIEKDSWSNSEEWSEAQPVGAGMCVRRPVLRKVFGSGFASTQFARLGRRGDSLMSHDDYVINRTACQNGWGCGTFARLKLTHLIPSARVTKEYLIRLHEGLARSTVILKQIEGQALVDPLASLTRRVRFACRLFRMKDKLSREFVRARALATSEAIQLARRNVTADSK